MEKILTDHSLTQEQAKLAARKAGTRMRRAARQVSEAAQNTAAAGGDMLDPTLTSTAGRINQAVEQGIALVRSAGGRAWSAASDTGAAARDLPRRARDQASAARGAIYQQGARTGEYLTGNLDRHPMTALLIAGAVGFLTGFLIHASSANRAAAHE
jgi:ElaB/YqjD/DUF883 family membrane-anchored ribosome-binding protein